MYLNECNELINMIMNCVLQYTLYIHTQRKFSQQHMNVLVKHSILQHLQHVTHSKIKNQYPIQTVAAEHTNGIWTSTDLLGLVTTILTSLLCKQVHKSVKASTLPAELQETFLCLVVPWINSVNICHLPVDNIGSILAVQYCHMVPSHKMHLNWLLRVLQHSMKDVNSVYIMANPLHNSRLFSFLHFHLYLSDGKLEIYFSKLQLITQKWTVKNAIPILHGYGYINFPHQGKNISGN